MRFDHFRIDFRGRSKRTFGIVKPIGIAMHETLKIPGTRCLRVGIIHGGQNRGGRGGIARSIREFGPSKDKVRIVRSIPGKPFGQITQTSDIIGRIATGQRIVNRIGAPSKKNLNGQHSDAEQGEKKNRQQSTILSIRHFPPAKSEGPRRQFVPIVRVGLSVPRTFYGNSAGPDTPASMWSSGSKCSGIGPKMPGIPWVRSKAKKLRIFSLFRLIGK